MSVSIPYILRAFVPGQYIDQTNFHVRNAKWNPETHVHTECAKNDDDNGDQFVLVILNLKELLQA